MLAVDCDFNHFSKYNITVDYTSIKSCRLSRERYQISIETDRFKRGTITCHSLMFQIKFDGFELGSVNAQRRI